MQAFGYRETICALSKNRIELKELIKKKEVYLGSIDTSEIEDFSYLFSGARRIDFSSIEYWITNKAISMEGMFSGCKYFNSPIGY